MAEQWIRKLGIALCLFMMGWAAWDKRLFMASLYMALAIVLYFVARPQR